MGKLTVLALRVVLAGLLAGSLFVEGVIVPLLAKDLDDVADLPSPAAAFLTVTVLWVMAGQVVVVCTWRLVTMVKKGTVFSHGAFRYVDVMIGAIAVASLMVFALGVLLAPGESVAPGVVLLIGGFGLGIMAGALVVLVLRTLLAQAATMRAELAEVI